MRHGHFFYVFLPSISAERRQFECPPAMIVSITEALADLIEGQTSAEDCCGYLGYIKETVRN